SSRWLPRSMHSGSIRRRTARSEMQNSGRRLLTGLQHARLARAGFRMGLAFQTYAVPQFQVQQPPDTVIVVAMFRPVLVEQAFDRFPPEISAAQAAWFKEHATNRVQPRAGQPSAPRCGKTELGPVNDFPRQDVLDGLLENRLAGETLDL